VRKTGKHTLRNKKGQHYEALCYLRYTSFEFRGINGTINCVHLQEIEPNNSDDQPPVFSVGTP